MIFLDDTRRVTIKRFNRICVHLIPVIFNLLGKAHQADLNYFLTLVFLNPPFSNKQIKLVNICEVLVQFPILLLLPWHNL